MRVCLLVFVFAVWGMAEEGTPPGKRTLLMLTGKHYPLAFHAGEFTVHGTPVFIHEQANTGKGTGLSLWDGATTLAKYMEHTYTKGIVGKTVLELGCGTGIVGITASVLGARKVILTDLPYALENADENVERNKLALKGEVECRELDWTAPSPPAEDLDFIVASDVVWVEELIEPLVQTLVALTDASSTNPVILMGHQTRARASDVKFFDLLHENGFDVEEIPTEVHHPEFSNPTLQLFTLRRMV